MGTLRDEGRLPWFLPASPNHVGLSVAILLVITATVVLDKQQAYVQDPWASLLLILRQTAMLGIFALGTAVVIIAGGIDLSSGSMIAFGGTACAAAMLLAAPQAMLRGEPLPLWVLVLGVATALACGIAVGSLHAFLIHVVRMPPFVATLGSLVGLRSAARVLAERVTSYAHGTGRGSTQVEIFDATFRRLGVELPIPVMIFVGLALLCGLTMRFTVLGRHIYALGGNEEAARLSGLPIGRLKWFVYTLSAVTASLAGILYVADQGVAAPEQLARGYELNAIAAAVVGGCSLAGGVGTVTGVVLGVLFLRVVVDAVAKIIDVQADMYEGMLVGAVVILAVTLSRMRSPERS